MTCDDCIHNEACKSQLPKSHWYGDYADDCEHYKGKNQYLALRCSPNTTVYIFNKKTSNEIITRQIHDILITDSNEIIYTSYTPYKMELTEDEFDKTVFLTPEEAEKALEWSNRK